MEDFSGNSLLDTPCDRTPIGIPREMEQLTTTISGIILKYRDQIILAIEESCTDCYCLNWCHWIINIKILNIYTDVRNITTDDNSTFSIAGMM